jgi:SAM-dependent methyltransferase
MPGETASDPAALHAEQVAYWDGPGAVHWVGEQERMDAMLAPVAEALLAHAAVPAGAVVLDIGCGCGATSVALAECVGPTGRVIAADVSAPMLARARERMASFANVDCVLADAATHGFPPGEADLLMSRFGVMFFGDPAAAFANLRRAMKPGGRAVFTCWQRIDANPWAQIPLHAAYQHVPRLPKPGPEDPGPFSFADPDRVRRILTSAGFAAPTLTPLALMLDLAAGGAGLDDAAAQASRIGPAARAMREQPEAARAAAIAAIRAALAPHVVGDRVKLAGAIWLVDCVPA